MNKQITDGANNGCPTVSQHVECLAECFRRALVVSRTTVNVNRVVLLRSGPACHWRCSRVSARGLLSCVNNICSVVQ